MSSEIKTSAVAMIDVIDEAKCVVKKLNNLASTLQLKHDNLNQADATMFLVEKLCLKDKQIPSHMSNNDKSKKLVPRVYDNGVKRYCNTDFERFPWCVYRESSHQVECGICTAARLFIGIDKWNTSFDRYIGNGVKDSFIEGTNEWKYLSNNGGKAYERHEKSPLHKESIRIMLKSGTPSSISDDLRHQFVPQHAIVQKQNRKFLAIVLHSIKFLCCQKLPMFGDTSSEGLLVETIKNTHGLHEQWVAEHITTSRNSPLRKYTQSQYVNMFVDMMADQVMEQKYKSMREAQFLALIADEWTEIKSNKYYVSTNVKQVNKFLEESINFLGFDQLDDIKGATVSKSMLETLKWRNFLGRNDLMKVVHQSYDGASNMQGKEKGVVARILEECPNAKGHHCCAHNLQLSGEIVVSECPILRNHVLGFAQTLLKLLKF
jgi:hypothetical protein